MKASLVSLLFCMFLFSTPAILTATSDCLNSFQTFNNRGGIAPCKALEIDNRSGTCQPDDLYETFCDEMRNRKYRTCQGSHRCGGKSQTRQPCKSWDYNGNQPCPSGYLNYDCRGGCEPGY